MARAHVVRGESGAKLRLELSSDDVQLLNREYAVVVRRDDPGFPAELADLLEIRMVVEVE